MRLIDFIDFDKVTNELAITLSLPATQVKVAFKRFFYSGQESEWLMTERDCEITVQELKKEFLQDCKGHGTLTFAGAIAQATGLELINEPVTINSTNWIKQ